MNQSKIFNEIWEEREHVSQVSGEPLVGKSHPKWHWQFAHILPKSIYGKMKCDKRNIYLVTIEEHEKQTKRPNETRADSNWGAFWATFETLRQEYHRKG